MWLLALLACGSKPSAIEGGTVAPGCAAFGTRVDADRALALVTDLAASPRRSEERRAETRALLRAGPAREGSTVGADGRNFAFGSQAFIDADRGYDLAFVLESVGCACPTCQRVPPELPNGVIDADGQAVYLLGDGADAARWADAAAFAVSAPSVRAIPVSAWQRGLTLPETRFSDQAPLWDAGIPAVMVTDAAILRNPGYHTADDTVDPAFLGAVARGTAIAVAAAAGVCGSAAP